MLSWKAIIENYIIKYSNQINKATRPLKDRFGISYFTYHKIDSAGKYTVLVDRPDWAECYVNKKIFTRDPYLRHPSVYQSGICLVDSFGSQEYREIIVREGKNILDMDIGVNLIQKNDDSVEFFGFTGNRKSSSLHHLFLNHSQIFRSFATHFKKELAPVLKLMQKEAGYLIDLKGEDFFCKEPIHPEVELNTLQHYFRDLGMEDLVEKSKILSFREKQCLQLFVRGKSAKETAKFLSLSPRTVEFYFENIKNKTCCLNKREVLALAKKLEKLGFL